MCGLRIWGEGYLRGSDGHWVQLFSGCNDELLCKLNACVAGIQED